MSILRHSLGWILLAVFVVVWIGAMQFVANLLT